jgi:hypothetical protein
MNDNHLRLQYYKKTSPCGSYMKTRRAKIQINKDLVDKQKTLTTEREE